MTQYNTLNVKLFNLQPNKLEPGIKNEIEVILRLSSKPKLALYVVLVHNRSFLQVHHFFPKKFLLTNRQIANIRKAFANNLSANVKLSKTQLSKISSW